MRLKKAGAVPFTSTTPYSFVNILSKAPLKNYRKKLAAAFPPQKKINLDTYPPPFDTSGMLVSSIPRLSPAQIVRRLKMVSTKRIWREHPELAQEIWKEKTFWSDGYFCTSIGNTSLNTIRQYIESQG